MRSVGDLITIIKSISPGMWLPLRIKRGAKELDMIARFPVSAPEAIEHRKN
ncbi:MAG: hypothetical protein JKY27_03845 [Magnetovibrio sp.]|nr:hypothetical protein [Magnetovibrio sp.]